MRRKRVLTDFGLWVKRKLLELGFEQKDFVKEVGISETYLIDLMYGGRSWEEMKKRIIEVINGLEVKELDKKIVNR